MSELLRIAPHVEAALGKRSIVALESTIITHGMPWPQNAQVAHAVERIVREGGCEPATIAVVDGALRIGLEPSEIDALARGSDALKLSSADLAYATVTGRTGSTTVAATVAAASAATRAGVPIHVFATGGIGGVHRGWERTLDVSADLDALAAYRLVIVCAGPKAILDMPATLEALETRGVPVVGYGTDELPAFWSRRSSLPAPLRLDTAEQVAAFHEARERLGQSGGMLLAVPVPEADEIPADEIAEHIEAALAAGTAVSAKEVTPFLLSHMLEATGGRSLDANIALIRNNARVAAEVARAIG